MTPSQTQAPADRPGCGPMCMPALSGRLGLWKDGCAGGGFQRDARPSIDAPGRALEENWLA